MKTAKIFLMADFENGVTGKQFTSLGAALEWAHKNSTRILRTYS